MTPPSRSTMRLMWRVHKLLWNLSGGRLGSRVGQMEVLELTTIGHKSGKPRSVLLYYLDSDGGPLLAGSNLGSDRDPAWIENLRANPQALFRRTGQEFPAVARFLDGEEREEAFRRFVSALADYAGYREATDRIIPVVVLEAVS